MSARTFDARVKSLMTDVPDLPNFSHFHDSVPRRCRQPRPTRAISAAASMPPMTRLAANTFALRDPEIDRRLKNGPDLVSANFVIPYPPGFPIMVPGQVITQETIDFMRKLDVKEIHGYDAKRRTEARATGGAGEDRRPRPRAASRHVGSADVRSRNHVET